MNTDINNEYIDLKFKKLWFKINNKDKIKELIDYSHQALQDERNQELYLLHQEKG